MDAQKLEISRLFHRFGFGPRPGEFAKALADGPINTRARLLTVPPTDPVGIPSTKLEVRSTDFEGFSSR